MENNNLSNEKININSFLTLSVIGKGSYAKVLLVKKKDNGELYAIKVLKKTKIQKQRQVNHVYIEKNVLLSLNNPFLIKFFYSFQNESKLFFVLEYCPGGELFNLLQKRKKFTEEQARFFSAQMILALEHMHEKNIIYRDLKPENVLIDKNGYIKLTDFGLSKTNVTDNDDIKSICGTPEYLAPEILMKLGYGKSIDWWTLGCIIYEMVIGIPPFYCNDRQELFERIKFSNPRYPQGISSDLKDLLENLLKKDPSKRLCNKFGAEEIKKHKWFEIVNWQYLYEKRYDAPFIPKMKSEVDLIHFDDEFLVMPINSMSMNDQLGVKNIKEFPDFSYNNQVNIENDDSKMKLE